MYRRSWIFKKHVFLINFHMNCGHFPTRRGTNRTEENVINHFQRRCGSATGEKQGKCFCSMWPQRIPATVEGGRGRGWRWKVTSNLMRELNPADPGWAKSDKGCSIPDDCQDAPKLCVTEICHHVRRHLLLTMLLRVVCRNNPEVCVWGDSTSHNGCRLGWHSCGRRNVSSIKWKHRTQ